MQKVQAWCPVLPWRQDKNPYNVETEWQKVMALTSIRSVEYWTELTSFFFKGDGFAKKCDGLSEKISITGLHTVYPFMRVLSYVYSLKLALC